MNTPSKLPWIALAAVVALQVGLYVTRPGEETRSVKPTSSGSAGGKLPDAFTHRLDDIEARLARLEGERPGDDPPRVEITDDAELRGLITRIEQLEVQVRAPEDPSVAREGVRTLNAAIRRGDQAEVHRLLAEGVDVNGRDDDRRTPLAVAAVAGQDEIMQILLQADAHLERTSGRRGMTPLLAALDANQEASALALLHAGADARAVDKNGEGGLIWASFNGAERVVERMIDLGIPLDYQAHDGSTALMDGARKGRLGVVRQLLEAGAMPNVKNKAGETALALALEKGHHEVARLLRTFGAV